MKQKEGLVWVSLYTKQVRFLSTVTGNIARIVVQDLRPHIHQSEN